MLYVNYASIKKKKKHDGRSVGRVKGTREEDPRFLTVLSFSWYYSIAGNHSVVQKVGTSNQSWYHQANGESFTVLTL